MKNPICLALSFLLAVCPAAAEEAVLLSGAVVEYLGGVPGFEVKDSVTGKLKVTKNTISFRSGKGEFEIQVDRVTQLSGGEYAKRRVKGSIIAAVLLTPIALFALFGKKKRDLLIIEYSAQGAAATDGEKPELEGAIILRYKKKGGRSIAIESAIKAVTGLKIEKEVEEKK